MPHTPPVPEANQSPYPLKEPKHDHAADAPARVTRGKQGAEADGLRAVPLTGIAIGVGIGAVLLGGVVFALAGTPRKTKKGRKRA